MKRTTILSLLILSSLLYTEQSVYAARKKQKEKVVVERNSFDLYPEEFSAILKEALRHSAAGNFENAVSCFDERIYSFRKEEASEKTALRLELISADIQKQVRDYKKLQLDRASRKMDFSNPKNISEAEEYFSRLASIDNKLRDLGQQIQSAGSSGYPYYLSRFVLGIPEESNSGLAGTLEFEFQAELNMMLDSIWNKTGSSCSVIEEAFSDSNLFTDSKLLAKAEKEFENIVAAADQLKTINAYRTKLKLKGNRNQKAEADFTASMNSITALSAESKKLFTTLTSLQNELKKNISEPEDKIASIRSENDSYAEELVTSASDMTIWGKTAAACAKSHSLSILASIQDEKLSWSRIANAYRQASLKTESKCTSTAISKWVAIADYYADTGILLYEEDNAECEKLKSYMQGIDGTYYPSRCVQNLELLKSNIKKDRTALEDCKSKLNNGYIYRSNFTKQQSTITENSLKISELENTFRTIESEAETRLLSAKLAANEIEIFYNRSKSFNEKNNFQQAFTNLQSANNAYSRLSEELKNDGDIQASIFENLTKLRNEIIEKQQPVFNREIRSIKTKARTAYYTGDFERASSYISEADNKRDMWAKLLDISLEPDTELDRIKNFVNTAIAIKEGREIQSYDSKAPEMRQNLSLAGKYYSEGEKLISQNNREEAEKVLNKATEKINQVKIYYPRNKTASILAFKITKILDEKNFEELFRAKIAELKQVNYATRSSLAQESYSTLLDLYEMNSSYPGLKGIIENAEFSLGLKQKPADKTDKTKADKLAREANDLLSKAGRDTILLQQAKEKAQAALEIDSENNTAITVIDEVALRSGNQAAVVLSSADEALYQKALSDLQKNKVFDANEKLAQLLKNEGNSRSAKIIKLKKRIEAQL